MLFYLHYILMTSGLSGTSVLLAVYFRQYSDASQSEIGALLMTFPFVCLIIKPLFCSMADRRQAHRTFLIIALFVEMLGYLPFAIIPFFPKFYTNYPRCSWYILVLACHIGNGGLGVAWSLGDCLAMNMAQKKATPFGRMRLMGTIGWGVYGFIIGQINEVPILPKYVPAFIILHLSLVVEIILMSCWKADDFVMFDPMAGASANGLDQQQQFASNQLTNFGPSCQQFVDSLPSSLGGTLRMNAHTAGAFRDVFGADDLSKRLKAIEEQQLQLQSEKPININLELGAKQLSLQRKLQLIEASANNPKENLAPTDHQHPMLKEVKKNPQLVLLKMILMEDGRLIKYICLFTVFGFLLAPMNFLFLSMEEVCSQRGFNFSQLAGAVLISQATMETIGFLIVPWILIYVSRSLSMCFSFFILIVRFVFYAGWYYTTDLSPYWAVIGEWSHGLGFAVFCTIQADVALMFANQSRLFIPELRRLGYLSEPSPETPKELIEAEESSIKMALRATMQAIFDGFMSGLGQGAGALICGIFIEIYNYITLWQLFAWISIASLLAHQLIELTKCRWSDTFKPCKGTKAFEIKQLDVKLKQKQLVASNELQAPPMPVSATIDDKMGAKLADKPAECC